MADPLSSGAGKVAEEMLKEVQQSLQQAEQLQQAEKPTEVQFNQVLDAQKVADVQPARGGRVDGGNVLRAAQVTATPGTTPAVPAIGSTINQNPVTTGVQRIMEDVMQGQNKLQEIMSLALSGRNFSTQELLALQAGVYRFTQELELTSKVVEKATSTIKQTMNTQV